MTFTTTFVLRSFWTTIVYPGGQSIDPAELAAQIPFLDSIWAWDADAQQWLAHFVGFDSSVSYQTLGAIEPGQALFIKLAAGFDEETLALPDELTAGPTSFDFSTPASTTPSPSAPTSPARSTSSAKTAASGKSSSPSPLPLPAPPALSSHKSTRRAQT